MSNLKFLYWVLIGGIVILGMWGLVKSCNRPTKSEILKQQIQDNEKEIEAIRAKRDSANRATIPFSDAGRDSAVESVKRKTGLNLSVRKSR